MHQAWPACANCSRSRSRAPANATVDAGGFPQAFVDAGLPAPQVRMEGNCGGGPDWGGYDLVAETVRTLLPAIERYGIATAAEVDVETLAERMRAEVVAGGGVICFSVFWGVWAPTPAGVCRSAWT